MKIAIFIDGGYLDKVFKNEFTSYADLSKISQEICQGKEILRTYYYNCLPYQSSIPTQAENDRFSKAQKFYCAIERLPRFQIRYGKLAYRNGEFEQKKIDTLLSIDLVNLAASGKISDAVLVAGDSDFMPAVEVVKGYGVNVILYHSQRRDSYHTSLWQMCDERYAIDINLVNKIKKNP